MLKLSLLDSYISFDISSFTASVAERLKSSTNEWRMGVQMANSTKREEEKVSAEPRLSGKVKFKIYGEEMIEKKVSPSGSSSGRIYLPPDWADRRVKIIRVD